MTQEPTTDPTTDAVIGTASSDILGGEEEEGEYDEGDYYDYGEEEEEVSLDSLGPGACLFDGKIYVSAQQENNFHSQNVLFYLQGDQVNLLLEVPQSGYAISANVSASQTE